MTLWSRLLRRSRASTTAKFDTTPRPIDQVIYEMSGRSGSVSRTQALSVPAVQRGRNMICSVSTLPLVQVGPDRSLVRNPLLEQIDPDVPNVVTLAQTLEDLVFDAVSWWRITGFGFDGYPMTARHLDVSSVSVDPPKDRTPAPLPSGLDPRQGVVWVDGLPVGASEMIRFDSPNPAVLAVAGRAIKRAMLLDAAAAMYADDPRPLDYFSPAEGADEIDDDEVADILAKWKATRKKRATAWVPRSMKYNTVDSPSPADLQLAELQKQAGVDLSNALGIDPEELGISTTSRTYSNAVDRRRDRINDVLAPYMRAITDRLSMGDVTRRGYRVQFDLDDYLKSNPTERWATYRTAKEIGVLDPEEIRAKEGLPPGAPKPEPAPVPPPMPEPQAEPEAADAAALAGHTFGSTSLTFVDLPLEQFTVDAEARTIEGLAVPYGKGASKGGLTFRFEKGALQFGDVGRVKLLRDHDPAQAIGRAVTLTDTSAGLRAKFKVARGAAGDEALELAEDGVLDGLSVGVDFDAAADTMADPRNKGGTLVRRADLREVSLTAMPAFDDARVAKVRASMAEENTMPESTSVVETAPAVVPGVTLTSEQFSALLGRLTSAPEPTPAEPGRQVVNPVRQTGSVFVNEEAPYRFDRAGNLTRGAQYDFSTDLVNGSKGDGEALTRAETFMRAQFNTDMADAATLNPNRQRPDLYVDQKEYQYPIWDAINKGTLADATPFVLPKFSSSSGLVAAHSEGTEPTAGTFVATSQTITPSAVSGKVEITREAWDQGGNPQLSGIIWRQMVRAWFEALEASAVTLLDGLTPTGITLTTNAVDDALVSELELNLAALQYIRGGFRMRDFFVQIDLYKRLIDAVDADGRKLLPIIGPTNSNGTASEFFADVIVGGLRGRPAWALAATGAVAASSYLFDRNDVHGWATAPQRLQFEYEVRYVNLAIWGYKATANTDLTGVREVIYDPTT